MTSRPVFLTPHLDVTGGTERQVRLLVGAFARRGILVPVVTRRPVSELPALPVPIATYSHPLQDLLRMGRSVRQGLSRAPRHPPAQVSSSSHHDAARPNLLRRLADSALARRIATLTMESAGPPTVVHLHGTFSHVMCRGAELAARKRRIPLVVKIANEPDRVLALLRQDPLALEAVKRASALLVVSEEARQHFEALSLGPRVFLVPNAVELPERERERSQRGPLVYVGTLKKQKGVDVLLEAWSRVHVELRRQHPLRIVGEGPERPSLESLAEHLSIASDVRFVGSSSNVPAELDRASAFVLPSRWEGMPNALLEAMAHGLPCVATDIAGSRDLLAPEDAGWLVPPDDPSALAVAIESALSDPDTADPRARAARAFVEANHAPMRIVERLLEVYSLVGG